MRFDVFKMSKRIFVFTESDSSLFKYTCSVSYK